MKFSLSGRYVELGAAKHTMTNAQFIELAKRTGYEGVDLRASQLSPDSPPSTLQEVQSALKDTGLHVAIMGLKDAGEKGLAALPKVLEMAKELHCGLIRIGGDAEFIKKAADLAAPHGIRLGSQMHTGGEFETFALAQQTLARIGRPNFGLITEPANHYMAGDTFTADNFRKIAPQIFASNIQSLVVLPPTETASKLKLRSGTTIGYKRLAIQQNTPMNIPAYFAGLRAVGFDGWVNMLEPVPEEKDVEKFAREYLVFLKRVARG